MMTTVYGHPYTRGETALENFYLVLVKTLLTNKFRSPFELGGNFDPQIEVKHFDGPYNPVGPMPRFL